MSAPNSRCPSVASMHPAVSTRMILLGWLALLSGMAATSKRSLLQSLPAPQGEMVAVPATCSSIVSVKSKSTSDPPACGSEGQNCCCSPVDAPPKYYTCCHQPNTYCQFFDFEEFGPEGPCPPPSLCLPVPSSCGGLNQPCCPPVTTIGDDFRCNDPNLNCVGTQVNHTFKAFLSYSKDPTSVPLDSYGTCTP